MRKLVNVRKVCWITVIIASVVLLSLPALASSPFEPVFQPRLEIEKSDGAISIDGELNDAEWKGAARVANFVERSPGDNTKPEVETEAFITYDNDNLYVAFVCYDDPATIRATMCQRDQFNGDDAVCLLIDTYCDASWAYEFFVNPYGIQKDRLWTSVGGEGGGFEDLGYDLIWESAARITASGYQVEMAIPFESIRFPNKEAQTWKVDFWRNRPRESYTQYSWSARDRNEQCWPCQWGTVEGIRNVRPGKGIEILPTVLAYQSGSLHNLSEPDVRFRNSNPEGELSLGGKYSVSSDVTVEASINPDFSQIESDAAQIDVNTTHALYYPERRPFFQEGSDIFRTLFNSFYSRMINDPQLTAKVTGRMGRTSIGFLGALDENTPYMIPLEEGSLVINSGKSVVNVLRGSRGFGDNSMIGFIVSDRRLDGGGSGSIAAIDGRIRLSKNYSIDGQFIASHTREPDDTLLTSDFNRIRFDNGKHTAAFDGESFYGSAFITRFNRDARSWNFFVDYNQVSPTYRTETGYDPWIDYRNLTVWTGYNIYPKSGIFERITPQSHVHRRWNFDGVRKIEENNLGINGRIRIAQTYFHASFSRNYESWSGVEFDNLWMIDIDLGSRIIDQLGCDVGFRRRQSVVHRYLVKGNETAVDASIDLKPIDRLIIEPGINLYRITSVDTGEELFEGYITRTRIRYQANRELSFRLVLQYDDFYQIWEVDPLLTYRLSSFSVLYIGSTYDYSNVETDSGVDPAWKMTSRQFFMKLQYLFQT
ncbi:MAG: carbohydrate binding family 9 domain-containing protein [Candidatus Zixiibacteriota bacterium]